MATFYSRYHCSLRLLNVLLKLTHFVQIPFIILELMITTASCRKKKKKFHIRILNKYKCVICCLALDMMQVIVYFIMIFLW